MNASYTASQLRAMDKATVQAKLGNLPALIGATFDGQVIDECWRVPSRSSAGLDHYVALTHDQAGITTTCDCAAWISGRCCWHRAAARLAHQDAIASQNTIGYRIRPRQQMAS